MLWLAVFGRRLDGFQRLAVATTATTYLLILVGALVRASGSGMGCPDWPKCFGLWVPPISAARLPPGFDPSLFNAAKTWTEYVNRLLGASTGCLIFATLVAAWRKHRGTPNVLWPSALAFLGVGFEGWLGGRVVAHGLAPWIVTAHLVGALVVVGLLLYATVNAFAVRPHAAPTRRLLPYSVALLVLTLVQIGLGTQVRAWLDTEAAREVSAASLLSEAGGLDLAHRQLSLLVGILSVVVWRRSLSTTSPGSPARIAAALAAGLAFAQVAVGLVLAYAAFPAFAQVAHVVIASLLMGAQMVCAIFAARMT